MLYKVHIRTQPFVCKNMFEWTFIYHLTSSHDAEKSGEEDLQDEAIRRELFQYEDVTRRGFFQYEVARREIFQDEEVRRE